MEVLLQKTVERDHRVTVGGPGSGAQVLIAFRQGEMLTLRKVSARGEYPDMYELVGYTGMPLLSRGVLSAFLSGFERPAILE